MAKALVFQRDVRQAITVDTVNNRVTAVGAAIASVDTTSAFPGRTRNNITVYEGNPYLLYRHASNEVRLSVFQAGAWANVGTFPAITTGSGTIHPIALQVDQDFIVAVAYRQNTAGVDALVVRRSQDGVTWDPDNTLAAPTQPTVSEGDHSVVWRNTLFLATASGIAYYVPTTDTLVGAFDTGDDALLGGAEATAGSFVFWNGSLYFVQHGSPPAIYKLDDAWDPASPVAPPAWTRQLATGVPAQGTVTVGPDTGSLVAFVNRNDELCLLYSAQLGTKLVRSTVGDFPAFTDVTDTFLSSALSALTDVGFSLYVDDRRRVNELQSFLLRQPAAGNTQLLSWDGVNTLNERAVFTGRLFMPGDERFGALRTFTNLQPTTHIRATSQPFPGRTQLDYTVRDSGSRPVDVFGEYTTDGDVWLPMTQGDGDSGNEQLATSPAGTDYTFFWDAFSDLDGDFDFMNMRIVARISGV